jgi:hypothetical protein
MENNRDLFDNFIPQKITFHNEKLLRFGLFAVFDPKNKNIIKISILTDLNPSVKSSATMIGPLVICKSYKKIYYRFILGKYDHIEFANKYSPFVHQQLNQKTIGEARKHILSLSK